VHLLCEYSAAANKAVWVTASQFSLYFLSHSRARASEHCTCDPQGVREDSNVPSVWHFSHSQNTGKLSFLHACVIISQIRLGIVPKLHAAPRIIIALPTTICAEFSADAKDTSFVPDACVPFNVK
jgi:hypothetical protein